MARLIAKNFTLFFHGFWKPQRDITKTTSSKIVWETCSGTSIRGSKFVVANSELVRLSRRSVGEIDKRELFGALITFVLYIYRGNFLSKVYFTERFLKNEEWEGKKIKLENFIKYLSKFIQNLLPISRLPRISLHFYKQTCSISKLLFPLSTIFERNFSSTNLEEGKEAGSNRLARSRGFWLYFRRGGSVLFIILPRLI